MDISNRLKIIADMVSYETMADIGTDHGYVPIYLHKMKRLKKAIACDINAGPLERARENMIANKGEQTIETRLGNGLEPLAVGEVESVVIAGMGGMLTISLLQARREVVQSLKELILSPQLDWEEVRRYLHEIEFSILEEQMLVEAGKYYVVIHAIPQKERYEHPMEYRLGKKLLERKDTVLKEYVVAEIKKMEMVQKKLMVQDSIHAQQRRKELENELQEWKEVLQWLSSVKS